MPLTSFIPANESWFHIRFFGWFTKWLCRFRFRRVWIRQETYPKPGDRTIWFLNHTSWWDGLIPLLLNNYRFHQQARALMEDKQMVEHKFFSRIGAFSVNLDDPRSSVISLRYAVDSMKRDNASLFIYPEGKIVPWSIDKPEFRAGLPWLCKQLPEVGVVPVAITIHTMNSSKPEIHICIGKPCTVKDKNELEEALQSELIRSAENMQNADFWERLV